jgi:hypothetical protein
MRRLFEFHEGLDPFIYLPQSARRTIKGNELLLVENATRDYVVIDDNNGAGRKYGIPRSVGRIIKLEISL